MYKDIIDEICDEYDYDNNLRRAIEIVFPLMVDYYNDLKGVKDVFKSVKIFSIQDISVDSIDCISSLMMNGVNDHIVLDDSESPYGNDNLPGAFYSYEPVFDKDMNVISEKKWIVTRDTNGSRVGNRFNELFGTTINIPFFLHELNHAYGMQNPVYKKNNGKIYSKHGMFETVDEIDSFSDKIVVRRIEQKNILIEEMINESITQKMICKYLSINNYFDFLNNLNSIGYVGTSYSSALIRISNFFDRALGSSNVMKFRKDNDYSIIDRFNMMVVKSSIYKKYCDGVIPYDYLSSKVFELFSILRDHSGTENNFDKVSVLFCDAMSVIASYDEINNGYGDLDKYEKSRMSVLGATIDSVRK